MTAFRVPVVRVDRHEDHPKNPNSTITYFYDRYLDPVTEVHQSIEYRVVNSRLEDGSPRFKHGDAAIFFPGDSVGPADYFEFIGYGGMKGNRVKAGKFQGEMSDGILTPVGAILAESGAHVADTLRQPSGDQIVKVGQDVKDIIGITKYVAK